MALSSRLRTATCSHADVMAIWHPAAASTVRVCPWRCACGKSSSHTAATLSAGFCGVGGLPCVVGLSCVCVCFCLFWCVFWFLLVFFCASACCWLSAVCACCVFCVCF